jgi:biopolymer transport protein ExbD
METDRGWNSQSQPHRYTTYERDGNQSDEAAQRRYNGRHLRFDQPDPYEGYQTEHWRLTMKKSFAIIVVTLSMTITMTGCGDTGLKESADVAAKDMQRRDVQERAAASGLIITVSVNEDRQVFLNKERVGASDDVARLKEQLARMLDARGQAYKSGAAGAPPDPKEDAGQKVVFVCAPSHLKYGEMVKVVEAIKSAGGDPIGLQGCAPAP